VIENCSREILRTNQSELNWPNGTSTDRVVLPRLTKTLISTSSGHLFLVEHDAHLWLLERSNATLVMRWLQQGKCHYAEQRWRLVAAVRSGTCAISRRQVRRGDVVYRPDSRPPASNAQVVILEEALSQWDSEQGSVT